MNAGKGWATTGFLLGVAVSVAGNVAHTWHPSAAVLAAAGKTADQWRPELGAQLVAAFFPMALLVTVEVLARVSWPQTLGWSAARYGGSALVAGVAAIVSYLHLRGLMVAYGEDSLTALIGPLSVDGLMVVSGFALIAIGRPGVDQARPVVVEPSLEQPSPGPRGGTRSDQPQPTVAELVESLVVLRPVPDGVVEDQAPDPAEFDQPIDQPDEGQTAGSSDFDPMESAVRTAKANRLPVKAIAETFGISQYQVKKILKASADPGPELVSTTSTTTANHNGQAVR